MTAIYLALAAALSLAALQRKRDWCTGVIAAGLIVSSVMIAAKPYSPLPFIAAIDAMTCLAMAAIWTAFGSMRAWSVGLIGLAKAGATMTAYLVDASAIAWPYALFINAAFLAQVIVAGGWADGLGSRLDRVFARIAPVRHGLLRNGAE